MLLPAILLSRTDDFINGPWVMTSKSCAPQLAAAPGRFEGIKLGSPAQGFSEIYTYASMVLSS